MALTIPVPAADEYSEFHKGYMAAVAHEPDAIVVLVRQRDAIERLRGLSPAQAGHRYAEGKWTVREIIGHLSDVERVFTYRLLSIARGESGVLPGFDQDAYAARSNADARPLNDLVDELAAVRTATLALVRSLDEAVLANRGTVSQWTLSVRALAYIIAGHFAHHVRVLREQYGITVGS